MMGPFGPFLPQPAWVEDAMRTYDALAHVRARLVLDGLTMDQAFALQDRFEKDAQRQLGPNSEYVLRELNSVARLLA